MSFISLTDAMTATILVTKADVVNLNNRTYTADSLEKAVASAQEDVALGALFIYDTHPEPVFNSAGKLAGYATHQNKKVGKLTRMWYDKGTVYATATIFDTDAGRKYQKLLSTNKRVSVSLRAMGDCVKLDNGTKVCQVTTIDGLDAVPNPALLEARVLKAEVLHDSEKRACSCSSVENDYQCQCEYSQIVSLNKKNITDGIDMEKFLQILQRSGVTQQGLDVFEAFALGQSSVNAGVTSSPESNPMTPPVENQPMPMQSNMPETESTFPPKSPPPNPHQLPAAAHSMPPPAHAAPTPPVADPMAATKPDMPMNKPADPAMAQNPAEEDPNSGLDPNEANEPSLSPEETNTLITLLGKLVQALSAESKETPPAEGDKPKSEKPPTGESDKTPINNTDNKSYTDSEVETVTESSDITNMNDSQEEIEDNIMENTTNALLTELVALLKNKETAVSEPASPATPAVPNEFVDSLAEIKELLGKKDKINKVLDAEAKAEAKAALVDAVKLEIGSGSVNGIDLTKFSANKVAELTQKAIETSSNKDEALNKLSFALSAFTDSTFTETKQKVQKQFITGVRGRSVELILDSDDKSWKEMTEKLDKAVATVNKKLYPGRVAKIAEYAKVNEPFIGELMDAYDEANSKELATWAAAQKQAMRDGDITDSAILIANSDLRNMPIISRSLIRQTFQNLKMLQYVQSLGPGRAIGAAGPGGGPFGSEFKIPSVIYVPPTHNAKHYVSPTDPIPQANSAIRYQSFWAELRATGFSVSDELVAQLRNGALELDPVALMVQQITDEMARVVDTHLLEEHQRTCDAFGAVQVSSELSVYTNTVYSSGGSVAITYDGATVTYGSNCVFAVKALSGASGGRPIVLPLVVKSLDASGSVTSSTSNAISVTFASTTQVRGVLDENRVIQAINPGETPTYAVDFERGYFLFKSNSGVVGSGSGDTMPTLNYYYATNYVSFDLDPTTGMLSEDYYDGLLNLMLQTAAIKSQSPNFANIDTALFPANIGKGALGISSLFHNRKSPNWVGLDNGFANSDMIGNVGGISVGTTNATMFAGDRRAILFMKGMVGYGVQSPAVMDGPYNNFYAPSGGGQVQMTAGQQWAYKMRDAVGTPLPLNSSSVPFQHPGITIRFTGTLTP